MNEQNDGQKQEAGDCGPECSCGTSGPGGRGRWIVGIVILLVAGVLVARALEQLERMEQAEEAR